MPHPMAMRWGKLYKGTPAEHSLEEAIAELGVVYRTQFPGYLYGLRFFPDFYLPTLKLVIEVDDPSHLKADKKLADAERTAELEDAWGVKVVRCTNHEALTDPRGALKRMLRQAGIDLSVTRTPSLSSSLPQPKSAPQKNRREALSDARAAKRHGKRKEP